LVAAAAVERQFHADDVGFLHGDPEAAGGEETAELLEILHVPGNRNRPEGYPSRRWPICLPKPASWRRSVTCRTARWPAMARSRTARGCPGGHGWWRVSWPAPATRTCRGTGSCAATAASPSRRARRALAGRCAGCARRAWRWRTAGCGCGARTSIWTPCCGGRTVAERSGRESLSCAAGGPPRRRPV